MSTKSSLSMEFESWLKSAVGWNGTRKVLKVSIFNLLVDIIPATDFHFPLNDSEMPSDTLKQSEINRGELTSSTGTLNKGLTCIACKLVFSDVSKQQEHFRSQLHTVNLKRKIKGFSSLTMDEYISSSNSQPFDPEFKSEGVCDDDMEEPPVEEEDGDSSGGSERSDGYNEENDQDSDIGVDTLSFTNEIGSVMKQHCARYGATFSFHCPTQWDNWQLIFSAGLFTPSSGFLSRDWNRKLSADDSGHQRTPWMMLYDHVRIMKSRPLCCVLLLRSGRFAGIIFDGIKVLIHKTLRRYTIRAKAGGGQSSHDNKAGKAKSAGATMRRAGEQALKEDIAACLKLWSAHIQSCSLILVSVPKTMRSVLFESNSAGESSSSSSSGGGGGGSSSSNAGSLLHRDDARVSFVPFQINKPTLDEAKAVYERCTTITIQSAETAEAEAGLEGEKAEEGEEQPENTAFATMSLKKPESETPVEGNKKGATSSTLISCTESKEVISACLNGEEAAVVTLLETLKSQEGPFHSNATPVSTPTTTVDPGVGVGVGVDGGDAICGGAPTAATGTPATPYVLELDLASVLNMPDSLEEMRTPLHIASQLGMPRVVYLLLSMGASPVIEDVRGRYPYFLAKDKDTRDAFRRFRSAAGEDRWNWQAAGVGAALSEEAEKLQKQKEKEKKKRAAQRKKDQKAKSEQEAAQAQELLEQQEKAAALAEEERRANAVNNAGNCANCEKHLFGIVPLEIFDQKCCSSGCVMKLRRKLAADAAMKRMGGSAGNVSKSS